ncbi:craniofacial development protein 2-like [Amphiura filiformis]|uniref:craniofacial development protein 2-like n=1 Tax=Amphiura filiformis TaxID=82378 RepID=UPI003B221283
MNGNGSVAKPKIRVAKKDITIGTWNVRRYRWSVLGLAEVRWIGIGKTTTNDGHTLWYSGEDKRHERGVGFLVHRDIARSVLECRPISRRIIILRLAGQPFNVSIILAYAPTSTASDQEMDMFYQHLNGIMTTIPKRYVLLVIGDWNAKVGPDAYPTWQGTAGKFGLGVTINRVTTCLSVQMFTTLS